MTGERQIITTSEAPFATLRERELAARWRVSTRTLQRWRSDGTGPSFLLIGGSVRYRMSDVLEFEERKHRQSGDA